MLLPSRDHGHSEGSQATGTGHGEAALAAKRGSEHRGASSLGSISGCDEDTGAFPLWVTRLFLSEGCKFPALGVAPHDPEQEPVLTVTSQFCLRKVGPPLQALFYMVDHYVRPRRKSNFHSSWIAGVGGRACPLR